jgi:hypothetical protein
VSRRRAGVRSARDSNHDDGGTIEPPHRCGHFGELSAYALDEPFGLRVPTHERTDRLEAIEDLLQRVGLDLLDVHAAGAELRQERVLTGASHREHQRWLQLHRPLEVGIEKSADRGNAFQAHRPLREAIHRHE